VTGARVCDQAADPVFPFLINIIQKRYVVVLFEFSFKGFHNTIWMDVSLNVQSVSQIALHLLASLP
jgi:hypothetical protein